MRSLIISVTLALTLSIISTENADIYCDDPPDIQFATISNASDETYAVGTTVTYACNYGYSFNGRSRTIICTESETEDGGEWTQPLFSCSPQSCGDPGYIVNGRRIGSRFTFPNSVRYECEEGYKLKGLSTRYCQTSGFWSGKLPVCNVVTCNEPKDIANGNVRYNSLEYLSELKYKCDKGFHLNTDEKVYCTAEGQWSKTDVDCAESTCGLPSEPKHGSMQLISTGKSAREGSIVIYSCDVDRIPDGPTTSKCLENGQWTFPTPNCLPPCSIPFVSNGEIGRYDRRWSFKKVPEGSRIQDNEELYLKCSERYEASGTQMRERGISCSRGKWSDEPHCEPAPCRSNPPKLPNAETVDVNPVHGGRVTYHCLTDFKKIKNESVVCDFGHWRGYSDICKSTRCEVNLLNFPGLLKGYKSSYKDGEAFDIKCQSGYRVANDGRLWCESGDWKGYSPLCIAESCLKPPPDVANARVELSSRDHGSFLEYICEYPYTLVEKSDVHCSFGEWKGRLPRCADGRCYTKDLEKSSHVNHEESPNFVYSGNELQVICTTGYSPRYYKPYCLNGKWTRNDDSPCKENECTVPRLPHGELTEEILGDWYLHWFKWTRDVEYRNVRVGKIVSPGTGYFLECDRGYSYLGSTIGRKSITCKKGKWTPAPYCIPIGSRYIPTTTEEESSKITRPSIHYPEQPSSSDFPATTPVLTTSVSNKSTIPIHTEISKVTSTTESPTTESDECSCVYPMKDENLVASVDGRKLNFLEKVKNGSVVVFRCQGVGIHRFSGRREMKCDNCQTWHSSDFPTCIGPTRSDAVIIYKSTTNISAEGRLEIWKGQNFKLRCIAMNSADFPKWTMPSTNGVVLSYERNDREKYGDSLYISELKLENIDFENEGTYSCSIGNDSVTTVDLVVIDFNLRCPEFLEDDETVIHYSNERRVTSKATFSCKYWGRELVGEAALICLTNGKWSHPPPRCQDIKCKVLKETEMLSIYYPRDREIGSDAIFHCKVPGIRSGVAFTTCMGNGSWSDSPPTCENPPCHIADLFSSMPVNAELETNYRRNETVPYNATVKMTCRDDLIVVGNPVAKCEKNKIWNFEFQCLFGCPSLQKPPDSKLIATPDKETYDFAEAVTFSCPPGLELNKNSQLIMCMKYGWSDTNLPECEEKID